MSTIAVKDVVITRDGYFYKKGVRDEPHSVIAKMNFGATGGGSAETNAAQWFATGKAAERLAENPATPAAISGNPQVGPQKELNLSKNNVRQIFSVIRSTYYAFDEYIINEGKDDKVAFELKARLDTIDSDTYRVPFKYYLIKNGPVITDLKTVPDSSVTHWKSRSFLNVMTYLKNLNSSIENGKMIIAISKHVDVKKESDDSKLSEDDLKVVKQNIANYEAIYNESIERIAVNHDVVKFIEYFSNKALFRLNPTGS